VTAWVSAAITEEGRWRPGIGDPTVMGWLTVVAYFGAVYLAARAVKAHRLHARWLELRGDERAVGEFKLFRLWAFVTMALLLLGINKQLDLQTWFTETARDLAIAQGWYEGRRPLQVAFIFGVILGGAVFVVLVSRALSTVLRRALGAIVGLSFLAAFVAIRAASFHQVDVLLGMHPVRLNWVLELGGIGVLAVAAYRTRGRIVRTGPSRE
jgi:hypothetical protein